MTTTTFDTLRQRGQSLFPGIAASAVVAAAAMFLSEHYAAPVMLFALLLGMAMNFLATEAPCKAGIEFTAREVLRIGVALLGMRITLEQIALEYGAERRRLRVVKMRGIAFRGGYHDFTIAQGGITVYPRLVAAERLTSCSSRLSSSNAARASAYVGRS